ncbi:galactose oxidase early set domain-containing protein, partial [Oryzihumus sp.]|uniref:galactose oxidase early set domain-containing protein n=1 Tax=Oryzihumus sp. TaxID=1968903 RepID=UPI002EDA71A1
LTVFKHTAATDTWSYFTDLTTLPATATYAQASALTPVIPDGVDQITFGVSISADGTLTTDDYSLVDTSPTNLVVNPSLEDQSNGFPVCFEKSGWGTSNVTYTSVTGTAAHSGNYAEQITVSGLTSGDRKVLQLESSTCAPKVTAGHQYQASVWYESTTNSNALTVFKHTAATDTWSYFTDLTTLPATATYAQASALTPVIPDGVDQISFGVSIYADGTLTTDDYSLTDTNQQAPPPSCTASADVCAHGRWDVLSYPNTVRAIHSVMLNNGKVLLIAGSGNDPTAFAAGTFKTTLWDPVANSFTDIATPADMFCAGHVQLPNGNVLVMGGNKAYPAADGSHGYEGLKTSYVFNITTNAYQQTNDMNTGHWYPSATEMGNGDVLSLGGLNEAGQGTVETELFSNTSQAWLAHDSVPQTYNYWGLYPSMILMQDGRLFYTGSHVFGNQGPSGSGADIYDFAAKTITDIPGLQDPQERDQSAAVLLPPAQDQKVMIMGGGNVNTNVDANRYTDLIDLMAADPSYTPGPLLPQGKLELGNSATMTVTDPGVGTETGAMGKMYVSAVLMPDRKILETGGGLHNRADAVYESSIYDPATNSFQSVTPDPVERMYHSESFLLPDGRIVSVGSNPGDGSFDMRISVYSPPYMFASSRPKITSLASQTWAYGSTQRVTTDSAIVQAELIRPAAVTHSSDPNQRLVDLPITQNADGSYSLNLTSNPNLAPPGSYMLNVVRADHVPSTSVWVKVGS